MRKRKINKKIGILTLNGFYNYGNVLQNVAMQKFFKKLGYNSETIWYSKYSRNMKKQQKIIMHLKEKDFLNAIKYHFKIKFDKEFILLEEKRKEKEIKFKQFCEDNINYSKYILTSCNNEQKLKKINNTYVSFFSGSDQVWGLDGKDYPEIFFLPFADKRKRNSFAASFGFSNIPKFKLIKEYKNGLNNMNSVSVREYEGRNIVNEISNKKATLLLDPVFLLKSDEWEKMIDFNKLKIENRFLLTYFLGKKSQVCKNVINDIAKKNNLKVLDLNDIKKLKLFSISPDEYLYLFQKASYIVTDSFHGLAFSIIFKKDFLIFDRDDNMLNMNSRIKTLLSRMELDNRFYNSKNTDIDRLLVHPDFRRADEVIEKNKSESKEFVIKALSDVCQGKV